MYRRYYSRLLFAFVCLSMIGVSEAWSVRTAYGSASETGGGDVIRQVVYVALAFLAVGPYLLRGSPRQLRNVPLSMFALLAWCAATLIWSPVPEIAARRLALTALVIYTSFAIVRQCSPRDALRTFWHALLFLVVLSFITAIVSPRLGIHQPGDPDANIVGHWRGIFYHKNKLGAVAAVSLLLSVHFYLRERARLDRRAIAAAVLLSAFVLIESGSKTSMGMGGICCVLQVLINIFAYRSRRLVIGTVVVVVLIAPLIAAVVIASGSSAFSALAADSFTGRGLIWQLAVGMMKDSSSLIGIGFQSVFQVGDASIFAGAAKNMAFLATISHAHNSYLELFISIGLIGCVFALFAIVVDPMRCVLSLGRDHDDIAPVCLSIILFVYLQSLLESEILNRDSIAWISFLLAYAVLRSVRDIYEDSRRVRRLDGGTHVIDISPGCTR